MLERYPKNHIKKVTLALFMNKEIPLGSQRLGASTAGLNLSLYLHLSNMSEFYDSSKMRYRIVIYVQGVFEVEAFLVTRGTIQGRYKEWQQLNISRMVSRKSLRFGKELRAFKFYSFQFFQFYTFICFRDTRLI
jgi:hypothetical protein